MPDKKKIKLIEFYHCMKVVLSMIFKMPTTSVGNFCSSPFLSSQQWLTQKRAPSVNHFLAYLKSVLSSFLFLSLSDLFLSLSSSNSSFSENSRYSSTESQPLGVLLSPTIHSLCDVIYTAANTIHMLMVPHSFLWLPPCPWTHFPHSEPFTQDLLLTPLQILTQINKWINSWKGHLE